MCVRVLLVCALTVAAVSSARGSTHDPHEEQPARAGNLPNIVFLLADDLGYGDVEYNGANASTPNLNAMVSGPNSIHLTRYYSGGPVCSPTRGTLLTGRNHNRYCIWTANTGSNKDDFAVPERMPLPTSEITVADILKQHGYQTAIFGKWHLGDVKPVAGGNTKWPVSHPGMHGFDEWWVTERSAMSANLNCACFNVSNCPLGHYTDVPPCFNYYTIDPNTGLLVALDQPINGDDSHFLLKEFAHFLDGAVKTGQPFFVYLPFHTVHIRYLATLGYTEPYVSQGYNMDDIDYYGAITAMDDAIGQLRQLLKSYNISNNTMLWFTSDNGPAKGTPGVTAGFRGQKGTLFEGGIRVPGIIEWPDMIKSNRKSDFPVVSSDFLPTVCDILGVSPPTDRPIDGMSILPFIRGEKSTRNKSISWAYNIRGNFNRTYNAVINGDRYKLYAEYHEGEIKTAYLYDLVDDPFETEDVSNKQPAMFASMKAELEEWMQSVIKSATETVKCYGYTRERGNGFHHIA